MIIVDPAGSKKIVVVDSFAKTSGGLLWTPVTAESIEKGAEAIVFPDAPTADERRQDVAADIKYLLDGLIRNPLGHHVSEAERAKGLRDWHWRCVGERVAFALTNGHRAPKPPKQTTPPKVKKMSAKSKGPSWYDENGKLKPGMPEGAYMRMRTEDAMVWLTEHRPAKNGVDWDQSIKMYGPFKTADEQRKFMCDVWRGVTKSGPRLDAIVEQMMAWRRYDEE